MPVDDKDAAHKSGCDCPLHRLTKEQRAELIDKAIDLTNEQIRNGTFEQNIEDENAR